MGLRGVGEGRGEWMGGWTDNKVTVGSGMRRTEGGGSILAPWVSDLPAPCLAEAGEWQGRRQGPANYTREDKFIASHASRNGLYLVSKGMTQPQEHLHIRKNKN